MNSQEFDSLIKKDKYQVFVFTNLYFFVVNLRICVNSQPTYLPYIHTPLVILI